eukprot:GHVR01177736.1.p1 GENE.GHVR01177736.1~~GHVR01177736.1.p1  ORF type:complete len:355 (+),score=145.09 GHVR01177736.1:80-1066(+)
MNTKYGTVNGIFDVYDNKSINKKKKRKINHVEGNFPTMMYIPVRVTSKIVKKEKLCMRLLEIIRECVCECASDSKHTHTHTHTISVESLLPPKLSIGENDKNVRDGKRPLVGLHISLSRLLMLREYNIDPFLSALRTALASTIDGNNQSVGLSGDPCLLLSEDMSTLVAALPVHNKILSRVYDVCDSVCVRFNHPPYYPPPDRLPHCSLAQLKIPIGVDIQDILTRVFKLNKRNVTTPTWLSVGSTLLEKQTHTHDAHLSFSAKLCSACDSNAGEGVKDAHTHTNTLVESANCENSHTLEEDHTHTHTCTHTDTHTGVVVYSCTDSKN